MSSAQTIRRGARGPEICPSRVAGLELIKELPICMRLTSELEVILVEGTRGDDSTPVASANGKSVSGTEGPR